MLLEEGFQVTSVDASDKMLKYALKERWERRKEEPFDRWGAGAVGAGRGLRTLTLSPSAVLGPLIRVALLRGDLPVTAARQRQAIALARLAAGQGPGKGWVMPGWGLAGRGGCWVSLPSSISMCCSH